MSSLTWPSFFPSECPPTDAEDASVVVFRIVSSDPPTASDFLSYAQTNPTRNGGKCKPSGLSVFTGIDDALDYLGMVPGEVQGDAPRHLVARALLSPEAGKIKHTPSAMRKSHHTWWAPDGFDHAAAFKVVT
jgi:hypothetical protein